MGAAYGTAKSGTGIAAMSVMRPELIMRSVIPVVMAGIIGIYGLVVAAVITNTIDSSSYKLFKYVVLRRHHCSCLVRYDIIMTISNFFRSFTHLGAGLSVGISGLAAGYAIGVVGDAGVRGTAQQPR